MATTPFMAYHTYHVAPDLESLRPGNLVVVRYESQYHLRQPVVLVVVETGSAQSGEGPLRRTKLIKWRHMYSDREVHALQQTLDALDLNDHDPHAVVNTFQ